MRVTVKIRVLLFLALAFASLLLCAGPARAAALLKISNTSDADAVRVILFLDAPVTPATFALSDPARVVVDLPGTALTVASASFPIPALPAGESDLKGIRVGQFSTDTVRVVFDVSRAMPHKAVVHEAEKTVELILDRKAAQAVPPTQVKPGFNEGTVTEAVRPGVVYTRVAKKRAAGPIVYHVLDVDVADPHVRVALALANGNLNSLEALSATAKRSGAAFAVNGGYFNMQTGEPFDMVVADGNLITRPDRYRGFFGMGKDGKPVFARPTVTLSAVVGNRPAYYVSHLNRPPGRGSVAVFDSRYGARTGTADYRTEFIVDNGKVTQMVKGGNAPIPPNGFVISLDEKHWDKFGSKIQIGEDAELRITGSPDPAGISCGVSAGPVLVKDGVAEKYLIEDFDHGSGIVAKRNPRTAAGMTHNGRLRFVVVEGRSDISVGASLEELAEIMVSLGCVSAVNLDGGGSSELIIDGKIRNNLNGAERKLANAFVIYYE